VTDLHPVENLALARLDIRRTQIEDLSPLRSPVLSGSLRQLDLWSIPATDFSPVAACTNLRAFDAANTSFADMEVLRGSRLRIAQLSSSKITNISVLAGMPLERVTLGDTAVTDPTPLLQCRTLNDLVLPRVASNVNVLRSLPNLERISFEDLGGGSRQSAEEFWLEYEHSSITAETVSLLSERSFRAPEDDTLAMKVAALQCWFGLDADYAATCKREIEIAEHGNKNDRRERAAKNWCLQATHDPAMLQRVLVLARETARREVDPWRQPWHHQTLGMAEFRAGNAEAAEAAFLKVEAAALADYWPVDGRPFLVAPSRFFRAMMLFRSGKIDEAKKLFYEAEAQMPPIPENAAHELPVQVNQDQLLCWLICREARAELKLGDK
jgi:hypothetical protein